MRLHGHVTCAAAPLLVAHVSLAPGAPAVIAEPRPHQAVAPPSQPSRDVVAEARQLARSGKRAEAIRMLQARLSVNPGDLDARTLLEMRF